MKTRFSMIAAAFVALTVWSPGAFGQSSSGMQSGTTSTHNLQLPTNPIGSSGVGFYDMGEGGTVTGSYLTGLAAFTQGFGQAA